MLTALIHLANAAEAEELSPQEVDPPVGESIGTTFAGPQALAWQQLEQLGKRRSALAGLQVPATPWQKEHFL